MARTIMHAALLRGINVGGKHKVSMKELAAWFEDAGCTRVATYIQSGNVVFGASAALAKRIPEQLAAAIEQRYGFSSPVVLRTAEELATIVQSNPFLAAGMDEAQLHVAFMPRRPTAKAIAALDPNRSPGDSFAVVGREVYLHLPNGMARTKLGTGLLDRTFGLVTTIRNWRTVVQLQRMTEG